MKPWEKIRGEQSPPNVLQGPRKKPSNRKKKRRKATETFRALEGNSTCNTQPGAPPQPCEWRHTRKRRELPWQLQLQLQPGPWSSLQHLRDKHSTAQRAAGPGSRPPSCCPSCNGKQRACLGRRCGRRPRSTPEASPVPSAVTASAAAVSPPPPPPNYRDLPSTPPAPGSRTPHRRPAG